MLAGMQGVIVVRYDSLYHVDTVLQLIARVLQDFAALRDRGHDMHLAVLRCWLLSGQGSCLSEPPDLVLVGLSGGPQWPQLTRRLEPTRDHC